MSRLVGLGLDLVDRDRIAKLLERSERAFLDRVFLAGEIRLQSEADPLRRADHVAGLFAAKEATMKALGTGWSSGVGFRQIEISRGPKGAPEIRLHGAAFERARLLGVERIWLTISHDGATAAAVVILEGQDS